MINVLKVTLMLALLVFGISSMIEFDKIYAEENDGYIMAENVQANFTFTYRDGVEAYQFPVFKMTSDFVSNDGTTFEIEGIIGKSPHLHKALDEAYKYRLMLLGGGASHEFNYRFFDVDVDLARDGQTVRTLHYFNCQILNYKAVSLNSNDYESYTLSITGFAVVDRIEFTCGGVNGETPKTIPFQNNDYGEIYYFAENVRTFITFEFHGGVEKIEFPSFELISGYEENDDSVRPSFNVEGVVQYYPLLYNAVDNARRVSGASGGINTDFNAYVEFSNGEKTLRALDFIDCRVSGAIIDTKKDFEEGFTGKSGFAVVNEIDFDCAGLKPMNDGYDQFFGTIWKPIFMENEQLNDSLRMAKGLRVMTTFTYSNGVEKIEFPIFRQGNVFSKANPTFELRGIVGDYPLLYKRTDDNLKIQSVSGSNSMIELFNVDVNLVTGELVRGFNYSKCRVVDYVVASAMNREENYIKGEFALENIFDFECKGYTPNNPMYDLMLNPYNKADTISTNDLRKTDDWQPGFYIEN